MYNLIVNRPTHLEEGVVERGSVRTLRQGVLDMRGEGLALLSNFVTDFNPIIISREFAEERGLKEGGYYVLVEYRNPKTSQIHLDIWRAEKSSE